MSNELSITFVSTIVWDNSRDPYTWRGENKTRCMFDRGFTGHEHLFSFGLINMNGRMYDPVMSSFLSVDSYVQSPENSQNFNRYAYCLNNPLKYTDPSGEELCTLAAAGICMAIGAAVNVVMNGIQNVRAGENFFLGYGKAAAIGAVQGLFSFGIGTAAEAIGSAIANEALGTICQAGFQVVAHGSLDGVATYARDGNFWAGFASGAVSSAISSATVGICKAKMLSKGWTRVATVAAGGLSGGVASTMAGGDFLDGLCNGLICAGLNHAMHLVVEGGGKLIKVSLKEAERVKAIRQLGDLDMSRNSAKKYEMMCKYADLEIVENYLLGSEGRSQKALAGLNVNTDTDAHAFYNSLAKNMDYNVYNANDYGLIEIAQSMAKGNPLILWTWDDCGGKLCDGHSYVIVGVEGYEGDNDFTLSVINTQNKVNNLNTTIKWSGIEVKQMVRFSLSY